MYKQQAITAYPPILQYARLRQGIRQAWTCLSVIILAIMKGWYRANPIIDWGMCGRVAFVG